MKLRVYVDTSVFGGCEEPEFRDASTRLIDAFATGKMTAPISSLSLLEIERGPAFVYEILRRIPEGNLEILPSTGEAEELASSYIKDRAIGYKHSADALHIATATVAGANVHVSWNFKQIVNLQRIQVYNSVNVRWGYQPLEIRTPREVVEDE